MFSTVRSVLSRVYETDSLSVGANLVRSGNDIHGYNTSLLAYGATGPGKTYTLLGTFGHRGRSAEEGGDKEEGCCLGASPVIDTSQLLYL